MTRKLKLDKAGRVVIPKPLRNLLRIVPGDALEVDGDEDRITLRPVRSKARLVKKAGVWVYHGEEPGGYSIVDEIDRMREARSRDVSG
jgi:AbrB family looped-hinge helix DNA binding protein